MSNKLKDEIENIVCQIGITLGETPATDKLYSLISDVAVKFAEWKNKVDWDIECEVYDNQDLVDMNEQQLFNHFLENIYSK